jgi:hypothetical protein
MQVTAEFECSRRQNPCSTARSREPLHRQLRKRSSTVKLKVGSYFSHKPHLFFNFLLKSCSARSSPTFWANLRASFAALRSHYLFTSGSKSIWLLQRILITSMRVKVALLLACVLAAAAAANVDVAVHCSK